MNTEYFEEVRITPERFEDSSLYTDLYTNLMTNVEEGRTGNFLFGGGFNTEEGVGGFVEVSLDNFDMLNPPRFSGGGQKLSLRLNIAVQRSQYTLGFTEPELFGYPIAGGFDVFNETNNISGGATYNENTVGGQLRLGKAFSPYLTARASFRAEQTDVTGLPRVNRGIQEQSGKTLTLSTNWQLERNSLDSYRDPARGALHVLSTTLAGFGGDYNYWSLEHDSTWYLPLDAEERWILSFRVREGFVTAYASTGKVPLLARMYVGGSNTVRGYAQRGIGPKERENFFSNSTFAVGGNMRAIANLELKYKITKALRLYTFFDSGGAWEYLKDVNPKDLRYSVGLGLGIDIPFMGPIRIDYGFALNPDEDQRTGRLHLMTGIRF